MKHIGATILLRENSSRGYEVKKFLNQTIEIIDEDSIFSMSVDGRLSHADRPCSVKWFGGSQDLLNFITDVTILSKMGNVILEKSICTITHAPRNINGGVEFELF
ncbi:hypothetical protein [Allorhizobium terrae]|uniref:Uncharacterized protein n=1 Tax=Allorhizobium terrae TaxID=1848972 RepID=A0A4S4A504_9HYPH|nr:hypothetical protein [Allorhizobium terrae]THF53601.1 hypothetical protein E6C51_00280 [Allorhizobium terrae]